jgi:flagellar basal-body rod protein FlgF
MDALIYTAMSGAEHAAGQQVHANNLANIDTGGFRANMELSTAQTVNGYGYDDRHMSHPGQLGVDPPGHAQVDRARSRRRHFNGAGFFDRAEFDRRGLHPRRRDDARRNRTLKINGNTVLGEGGPIVIPEYNKIEIGSDGTVSVQAPGTTIMQTIDKLRLVKAEASELTKNEAGLLVARDGQPLATDPTVWCVQATWKAATSRPWKKWSRP